MSGIEPIPSALLERAPIFVVVHVYHRDVWETIASRIEQILQRPYHLVLTTPHGGEKLRIPGGPFLVSYRTVVCRNRGRDILPFLQALRLPVDYDVGLKLHTKRSDHRLNGADWGTALVRDLLPDTATVDAVVDLMVRDRRLAIVAPDGMLLSVKRWTGRNIEPMRRAADRLGFDLATACRRTPVFAAGSMFWFRRDALGLLSTGVLDDLFEAESGQVDGTLAHALERLFAPIAESVDGVITTMAGAAAVDPTSTMAALRVASRDLADLPNPFIRHPPALARWALNVEWLRRLYGALPPCLRSQIRAYGRVPRRE